MTNHIISTLGDDQGYFQSDGKGSNEDPFVKGVGLKSVDAGVEIDVNVQDQTTPPFDLYFAQALGAPTTLTVAAVIDTYTINVASTANIGIGTWIGVFSGDVADAGKFLWAHVLSVSGNVLTIDTPIHYAFVVGSTVLATNKDLSIINGSVSPQIFSINAGDSGLEIDVTRVMCTITTDTVPQLNDFGDITGGLPRGLVLRRRDGEISNIFNWHTNSEMSLAAYDMNTFLSSNPSQGVNGLSIRYTFAGQSKHGVAVRVGAGEALELIIQDDLTSLLEFYFMAQGHIVSGY